MFNIYIDGSCKPTNPGPASGAFVITKDDILVFKEGIYIGVATNNVAEISGLQYALLYLKSKKMELENITFFADSMYVIGIFSKNWSPKVNQELISKVKEILNLFPNVKFQWVKGHSKDKFNDIVDKEAKNAIDDKKELPDWAIF